MGTSPTQAVSPFAHKAASVSPAKKEPRLKLDTQTILLAILVSITGGGELAKKLGPGVKFQAELIEQLESLQAGQDRMAHAIDKLGDRLDDREIETRRDTRSRRAK